MGIELNSREYECWHEVGHALVCVVLGSSVEFIEFLDDPTCSGKGRTRCELSQDIRKKVACGGFAAEFYLYRLGRLSVTESTFVISLLINAFLDKQRFFDRDFKQENGCWPAHMDIQFREFAIYEVVPIINTNALVLEVMAKLLHKNGRIDKAQINQILSET